VSALLPDAALRAAPEDCVHSGLPLAFGPNRNAPDGHRGCPKLGAKGGGEPGQIS